MNEVWIALIAAVVGPTVLHHLTQKAAKETRAKEWERQDRVAMAALNAADKLAHQNNVHKKDTDQKLAHVIQLTNSNYSDLKKEIGAQRDEIRELNRRLLESKEREGHS